MSERGYRLALVNQGADEPVPSLVDDRLTDTRYRMRILENHPELYRELAGINTEDPQSILAFANRYGLLDNQVAVLPDPDRPLKKGNTMSDGFPVTNALASWKDQAWVMRSAVTLWDELRAKNIPWLEQRITWRKEGDSFSYRPETENNPLPPETKNNLLPLDFPRWFEIPKVANAILREQFKPGKVLVPARYILQRLINENLASQVAPMLLWKRTGEFDLYFKPRTFMGALWLQFAQDVTNNHVIRRCDYCKKGRVIGAPQKKYCSDSCKSMACRAGKIWKQN